MVTKKALHISLVGMSNHGKSFWAEKLASIGFLWVCIDQLIIRRLQPALFAGGYSLDTDGVSSWMGMPWDERYKIRQTRYLALEEELTLEAVCNLDLNVPTVIDTTGSVVHLSEALLRRLAGTHVVFLDSTPQIRANAVAKYLSKPKPVAFEHLWDPRPGEKREESLKRCCQNLQAYRDGIYRNVAATVIPYQLHYESGWKPEQFLKYIQEN